MTNLDHLLHPLAPQHVLDGECRVLALGLVGHDSIHHLHHVHVLHVHVLHVRVLMCVSCFHHLPFMCHHIACLTS
jgi:hypothetical protein